MRLKEIPLWQREYQAKLRHNDHSHSSQPQGLSNVNCLQVDGIEARCNQEIQHARAVRVQTYDAAHADEVASSPLFRGSLPPAEKIKVCTTSQYHVCLPRWVPWPLQLYKIALHMKPVTTHRVSFCSMQALPDMLDHCVTLFDRMG